MTLGPNTKRFLRGLVKDELREWKANATEHSQRVKHYEAQHRTACPLQRKQCRWDLEAKREGRFLKEAREKVRSLTAALKELA